MILFPAIDIYKGRSVRLLYGKFDKVTDYGLPIEMAQKWQSQGAEYLHVVDLNGAVGSGDNLAVIREIVKNINIPIQLGGGARTLDDINRRLDLGVERVILGTSCYSNPEILEQAIKKFGAKHIVCGIDAKSGKVAIKGWVESVDITPIDLGLKMREFGIQTVVYTDISRDGALTGVNVEACKIMAEKTGLNVIASGGVSSLNDLTDLGKINMYGVILGKAIYEDKFDVATALTATKGA